MENNYGYTYTNNNPGYTGPNQARRSLTLLVAGFIGLLIILFAGELLYRYLTTGKIVVTTNSATASITVSAASKGSPSDGAFSQTGTGSLTLRVKAGKYVVSVQDGANGTNQYVQVKGRSTKTVRVQLLQPTGVQPVIYGVAQNVMADSTHLAYLNPGAGVTTVDANNNSSVLPGTGTLVSVSWADPTYGVGLDGNGSLFVINHNVVTPLKTPATVADNPAVVYAVAPNRTIYIGSGREVYSGTDSGTFTRIYDDRPDNATLAAGNNQVSIIASGFGTAKPEAIVVTKDGRAVSKTFDTPITGSSSWSPSSTYEAVVSGTNGEIFDSSLKAVATIPQGNITRMDWLDDDTLFYSIGSQLWSYKISSQQSQLVANMPLGEQVLGVTVGQDKSYVYMTTSQTGLGQVDAIRRIGLKQQSAPAAIYNLQTILPLNEAGYFIGLVNFSGPPTIVVYTADGSNSSGSLQAAEQTLQGMTNITGLRFVTQLAPEG